MVMQPSHPGVILTIAREHGSSGKQVGKRIAEQLHIPFYYKEMTALAAQESGLDREFISDINKNAPDHLHDIYLSTHVVQQAVVAQNQIIRKIADHGSCVIVGRAADFVLRDYESVIRIFYMPQRLIKSAELWNSMVTPKRKPFATSIDQMKHAVLIIIIFPEMSGETEIL